MNELVQLSLSDARDGLAKGDFSAVELTQAHVHAMEAHRDLNAYITEVPDLALERAKEADHNLGRGEAGALEGLPLGIKDLFCTEGILTTAASHILDGFTPPYESFVTANLKAAGAVTLGKTNLDEFAMGSSNESSYYGPAHNPWKRAGDPSHLVPGGSSGGSAAAVAARMCLAATGTDTGGSIRQPASFCGIVGMKPTYGRCSRWGIVAFSSSLDQAGPMTRTVRDSAMLLSVMAGHDPKDSTSADMPVPDFEAALTGDIKGLRIGIPAEYRLAELNADVAALWGKGINWLKDAGAEIIDIALPHTKYALPTYYIVAPAEASSNLARYDGVRFGLRVDGDSLDDMYTKTRAAGFGAEVKRRIFIGTYALSAGYYDAYYLKAQKVRQLIYQDFASAFENVDAILTPTTPTPAFPLGENSSDPVAMYLNDVFTVPASLAGIPGISVPAGLSGDGLPLGLQLLTKRWDEETLFRVAGVLEEAAGFTGHPLEGEG
ncbi:MAG: Asp-tRNA(Asn)/Glu-tRNA(Gln) amidotransferase subunit GatA [Rhodospirillaceae bacterium]|jgi:aspartyl-tRNA(Asn)/glutamyl-tRNA(Gln) amidotransferase subunit A|nr:Asp-tRNA(Asn)/Glu-tRNA(Gln) amidotransferase subunit GatA [Rhodospirillaceae bacterium]MBT5240660.1 Asp-tRNA(Asn)/Glu-tRNA(Gln) amidotransferase subunit GatA [Rhodospirillaceae bacterium]MBT5564495.1 Asp-tRNA(Asn)/Glu-tRNA(Gln) amidotransferase subunit GatA [Rhodospirillaceae bacterium]MBT6089785.1 Asp-tRNA(Asn)/Glu-tRNA(Gln) amidotransferase subunit GatA [Rhodospirillaceae bacterium]MBT7451694.1 Asp-tRNA(Asn)/Glu-tRNA(Gln) amidotransferase subunit GatA [Rhodospirillaceae bacterium]